MSDKSSRKGSSEKSVVASPLHQSPKRFKEAETTSMWAQDVLQMKYVPVTKCKANQSSISILLHSFMIYYFMCVMIANIPVNQGRIVGRCKRREV